MHRSAFRLFVVDRFMEVVERDAASAGMICDLVVRAAGKSRGVLVNNQRFGERFLAGERVLARRASVVRRSLRWCARRPLITVLLAAVMSLSVGAAILVQERHYNAIQRDLAEAERLLALGSTTTSDERRASAGRERARRARTRAPQSRDNPTSDDDAATRVRACEGAPRTLVISESLQTPEPKQAI